MSGNSSCHEGLASGSWGSKGSTLQSFLGPVSCLREEEERPLVGEGPFLLGWLLGTDIREYRGVGVGVGGAAASFTWEPRGDLEPLIPHRQAVRPGEAKTQALSSGSQLGFPSSLDPSRVASRDLPDQITQR